MANSGTESTKSKDDLDAVIITSTSIQFGTTVPDPDLSSTSRRGSFFIQNPNDSPRYFMGHESRGISLIINNRRFNKELQLSERIGTDADAESLEKAFTLLGFEDDKIHRCDDLTIRDMQAAMKYYASYDFSNMDCFICTILTHGKENGMLYGIDGGMALDQLIQPFKSIKNPSLIGKPKIFLIQACRGTKFDEGVELVEADGHPQRLALEADYLFAFSSNPGYFSWRNSVKGSWFVQSFVRVVEASREDNEMDFLKILTRVNYQVAYHFQSNVPSNSSRHMKKQMPSILSMLTKDLHFF